jgi:hypothetical protein
MSPLRYVGFASDGSKAYGPKTYGPKAYGPKTWGTGQRLLRLGFGVPILRYGFGGGSVLPVGGPMPL